MFGTWKKSIISRVPKTARTNICKKFRPIIVTLIYEELLELVVKDQLIDFCETTSILPSEQSGFRSKHLEKGVMNDFVFERKMALTLQCFTSSSTQTQCIKLAKYHT